jgi:hypothetical protein
LHPVATHGGNPRGRERRVRDRVLVLVAGAHIDRAAVRRWHRILSDAVARRYPTGVSSYCRACPCESGPLTRDGGNGCHTARPGVRRRDPTRSARGTSRRVARRRRIYYVALPSEAGKRRPWSPGGRHGGRALRTVRSYARDGLQANTRQSCRACPCAVKVGSFKSFTNEYFVVATY